MSKCWDTMRTSVLSTTLVVFLFIHGHGTHATTTSGTPISTASEPPSRTSPTAPSTTSVPQAEDLHSTSSTWSPLSPSSDASAATAGELPASTTLLLRNSSNAQGQGSTLLPQLLGKSEITPANACVLFLSTHRMHVKVYRNNCSLLPPPSLLFLGKEKTTAK